MRNPAGWNGSGSKKGVILLGKRGCSHPGRASARWDQGQWEGGRGGGDEPGGREMRGNENETQCRRLGLAHATTYILKDQQGSTVLHKKLCSVSCDKP